MTPAEAEAVRAQRARILESPSFAESSRLSALFTYLLEQWLCGCGGQIKESVIAAEVFDRAQEFDPRIDSIVRVQVRNLRHKLELYYSGEGAADRVRIALPKGSYAPEVQFLPAGLPTASTVRWRRIAALAGALALLVAGTWWIGWRLTAPAPGSIAVLPFANLSGGTENEYLSDGMADELMGLLETRPGLRVAARSSAFQYKGRQVDARQVARELQVTAVLEGSVQPNGDVVKVHAQLVDGRDGLAIWAQSFERRRSEMPVILHGIASGVAAELRVAAPPPPPHVPDQETQELYLRGVYLRGQRDEESRKRGLELLESAAGRDPRYAPALAAFAAACANAAFHSEPGYREWAEKAQVNAQRALAADDTNVKALYALAWVTWFHNRNWPEAEEGFRKAVALSPNYAATHNLYALGLSSRGRFPEAIAEAQKARELDPSAYTVSTDLGLIHYLARRFDAGERFARSVLGVSGGFLPAHMLMAVNLAGRKRFPEAVAEFRALGEPDGTEVMGRLGYALARSGDHAGARKLAGRIPSDEAAGGDSAMALAMIYTGLGDRARAFEWLDKAAERREPSFAFAGVGPIFDELRADARFATVRRRLGL